MADGALRGTSEGPRTPPISNQPEVSVPIELALQPPSEGTDSVVSGLADGTVLGKARFGPRRTQLRTVNS